MYDDVPDGQKCKGKLHTNSSSLNSKLRAIIMRPLSSSIYHYALLKLRVRGGILIFGTNPYPTGIWH